MTDEIKLLEQAIVWIARLTGNSEIVICNELGVPPHIEEKMMGINDKAVEAAADALKQLFVRAGLSNRVAEYYAWAAAETALRAAMPHHED